MAIPLQTMIAGARAAAGAVNGLVKLVDEVNGTRLAESAGNGQGLERMQAAAGRVAKRPVVSQPAPDLNPDPSFGPEGLGGPSPVPGQ